MTNKALLTSLLILAALACNTSGPAPTPNPTSGPVTPAQTEVTPTRPPSACPAPSSPPAQAQPASFANYADTILQYLNAGGDIATLQSTLASWDALPDPQGQALQTDLTGDGSPEIIVAVKDPQSPITFATGDLFIFGCQDGAYTLQYGYQQDPLTPIEGLLARVLQVSDANGDGRPDLAYTLSTCGAHTCYDALDIRAWNGLAFISLMGGELNMPYPTYTLTPGRIEAKSGGIGSVGAEPQQGYAEIWQWNGSVFTLTQEIWAEPLYRYHALLDGDRALRAGDYAAALSAYEQVISDDSLQAWGADDERPRLIAFARWRVLLVHVSINNTSVAQAEYDGLQADYPAGTTGDDVARMAATFWTAYQAGGRMAAGCQSVIAAAQTDTSSLDFFNGNYGYANPYWTPEDLCPSTQ